MRTDQPLWWHTTPAPTSAGGWTTTLNPTPGLNGAVDVVDVVVTALTDGRVRVQSPTMDRVYLPQPGCAAFVDDPQGWIRALIHPDRQEVTP